MVPVVITGNILGEATTRSGNIFYEATRGNWRGWRLIDIQIDVSGVTLSGSSFLMGGPDPSATVALP